MTLNKYLLAGVCGASMVAGGIAVAQHPVENVGRRHPNLEAAQRLVDQAFNRVSAAQAANEWDMGGHAAKAKDLLDQANREIKAAAMTANEHR